MHCYSVFQRPNTSLTVFLSSSFLLGRVDLHLVVPVSSERGGVGVGVEGPLLPGGEFLLLVAVPVVVPGVLLLSVIVAVLRVKGGKGEEGGGEQ